MYRDATPDERGPEDIPQEVMGHVHAVGWATGEGRDGVVIEVHMPLEFGHRYVLLGPEDVEQIINEIRDVEHIVNAPEGVVH